MSWTRAGADTRCTSCQRPILIGEPFRKGTVAIHERWCATCAKRRAHEDVPAVIEMQPATKSSWAHLGTFTRDLRARIVGSE